MSREIVFVENIELLPYISEISHRFVGLDDGDLAVKTELIFSGHFFKVSTISHPPHCKVHGAMVSNINEALSQVELAIRKGEIIVMLVDQPNSIHRQRVDISFAENTDTDD